MKGLGLKFRRVAARVMVVGACAAGGTYGVVAAEHEADPTPAWHTVPRPANWPAAPTSNSPFPNSSPTPYMGWDTWYGLGTQINEQIVLEQAQQLRSRGYQAAGYDIVWLDAGWWNGSRDGSGNITVDPRQWPGGMSALTAKLHRMGFKAGIYTDLGINGCSGTSQGSDGHFQQDADQFAAWGFDAVKADFCGGQELGLDPQTAYTSFSAALRNNASGRPMMLNVCNPFTLGSIVGGKPVPFLRSTSASSAFGPKIATSWRTGGDLGLVGRVTFARVMQNMFEDSASPGAAGSGHWNDPDYLVPQAPMSATEFRTQFTMWSMLAAPMMLSIDMNKVTTNTGETALNPAVIAIDQDRAGIQGIRVATNGTGDVWMRSLANGDTAIAVLNRGTKPLSVAATSQLLSIPSRTYRIKNVWNGTAGILSPTSPLRATVTPHSANLYELSPLS